jgi:hypothetical protein
MLINNAVLTGSFTVNGVNYITNTPTTGSNTFVGTQTISGSTLMTGSLGVTGSVSVSGSITATGTLTAQTLVVQTVTSSIVYSSGSNIFGNQLTDIQQMTGSVKITGSLSLNNITIPTSASLASTYLPLAGGTLTGLLTGYRGNFTGADGDYVFFINGGATAGSSYGLRINAGGNSSDYAIRVKNAAQTSDLFTLVGTGAATFSSKLTVNNPAGSYANGITVGGTGTGLMVYASDTGSKSSIAFINASNYNYGVIGVVSGTGAIGGDVFGLGYNSSPNTTYTSVLNWTSTGVVDLPYGQIKFPATQNPSSDANTLDDYEEGTFTPTVSFSTSGTVTYYLRLGTYTKIGRQVTVNLMANFSDNTGAGNVSVGNLPFTSNSTTNYRLAGSISGAGMTGIVGGLAVFLGAGSTTLDILQTNGGAYVGSFVTNANTTTDTDFSIGITYFTS